MTTSTSIDLLFLLFLVFSVFWGYFVGAISEIFSLTGLVIILAISMKTYNSVAIMLTNAFAISNVAAYVTAFVLVFLAVYVTLKVLKHLIEKRISRSETMDTTNKHFGMMIGFVKGAFIILVIGLAILLMPLPESTKTQLSQSIFLNIAGTLEPLVIGVFGDRELLQAAAKMNENPEATSQKIMQAPEFQKLLNNPKIQEFASDPDIKDAVMKKNFMALMSNKKFLQLMNDEEIMKMIRTIDLPKLMSESSKMGLPQATTEVGAGSKPVTGADPYVNPGSRTPPQRNRGN